MRKPFIILMCAAFLCGTIAIDAYAYTGNDVVKTVLEKQEKKDSSKTAKKEKSNGTKQKKGKRKFWLFGKRKEIPQTPAPPKPSIDRDGLFHVTKMNEDWFFEFPDSLIGRQFLITTRLTSVPSNSEKFAGEEVNEQTVFFEVSPTGQLLLRAHLLVNTADTTNAISKAVTISNGSPIIASFKVESHKDKTYKIKVSQFLNEDNTAVGLGQSMKKTFGITNMLGNLSYIEDIRSFPLNTEVRLVKTYNSSGSTAAASATGKVTIGLNLSFIRLPEKPMQTRYYDPRVGYFTVGYTEFSDQQQKVQDRRFITRYRLEPKPEDIEKIRNGELVEPEKPIIYYIDPATPKQWVPYLIQGVNDWQKAFEKAGFKNAIMAKEWPNDSTMSMEDARYCVIRYLASPIENAYGPHVSDPRTGEILESHICWYHNVMKLVHDWYMIQAGTIDEAAQKMHYDEELMGQLIRFVSSHEVGHTLGLRHNFGASSSVPVENLRNKTWVEKYGHTPSIMDYARFNYVAQPEDNIGRKGIFPRINDYDEWAIEWGYKPMFGAEDAQSDHAMLETLMKQKHDGNPRLWWGDGEGYGNDPRCQTEDLGDDAVKASEYGIKNLKRELANLPEWTFEEEDIYNNNIRVMWNGIWSQFMRYNGHVINNIGGINRNLKTNAQQGDIYTPQPRSKQKAAMEYVKRNIMTEPVWLREVSYARRITDDPQKLTATIASNCVARLMARLSVLNEEYTADEYLKDLTAMIMTETATHKKVSDYRRVLQNSFVDLLIDRYRRADSVDYTSARPYLLYTLKQLQAKTKAAAQSSPDRQTKAHFQNLSDILDRALVIK